MIIREKIVEMLNGETRLMQPEVKNTPREVVFCAVSHHAFAAELCKRSGKRFARLAKAIDLRIAQQAKGDPVSRILPCDYYEDTHKEKK